MLVRRLLVAAGGAGGFTVPQPEAFATGVTPAGWGASRIEPTYFNGKTYVIYNRGSSGDIAIRSYTHATQTWSSATVLHASLMDDWVHAEPTMVVRPDGKIVVAYSSSGGASLYRRISTNAEDISSFAAEGDLDSALSGTQYTYPYLAQLTDEANDPIYLFVQRTGSGSVGQAWGYSTSTDGGSTWSSLTTFFSEASTIGYIQATKTSESRVDFTAIPAVVTGGNFDSPFSLYHAYYSGGAFHKTDGTVISIPFDTSDMTVAHTASSDSYDSHVRTILDSNGHPMMASVQSYDDATGHLSVTRWNGSSWSSVELFADYAPLTVLLDHETMLATRTVGGVAQIFRYTYVSGSWSGEQLTSGSDHSFRPVAVTNADRGLLALWLEGASMAATGNNGAEMIGYGIP